MSCSHRLKTEPNFFFSRADRIGPPLHTNCARCQLTNICWVWIWRLRNWLQRFLYWHHVTHIFLYQWLLVFALIITQRDQNIWLFRIRNAAPDWHLSNKVTWTYAVQGEKLLNGSFVSAPHRLFDALNHVAVKQSCNIHRNVDEYVRTALRRHVLTSVLGTCDNHRAPTSLACLHEFIDESKPSSAFGPSDVGRSVGQADPLFALLQHTCQWKLATG